ncbi:hypothetical protein DFR62_2040 [Planococcus citreus]|uniref:Uncharacterized protein n=1 Tax=Planococcus citreus TaxID=1373 RepID=A0A497YHX4_9BACL|nr:hypothetical protein DFR62_2040 [Planococcus citreus]
MNGFWGRFFVVELNFNHGLCINNRECGVWRLRFRGTLSGGLALSRFVTTFLQGLNCLAIPPGVGPFRSISVCKINHIVVLFRV